MNDESEIEVGIHEFRFWNWSAAADVAQRLNAGEPVQLGMRVQPARGGAGLEPGWRIERGENGEWDVVGIGL